MCRADGRWSACDCAPGDTLGPAPDVSLPDAGPDVPPADVSPDDQKDTLADGDVPVDVVADVPVDVVADVPVDVVADVAVDVVADVPVDVVADATPDVAPDVLAPSDVAGDGVSDTASPTPDECPDDPGKDRAGVCGCGLPDSDVDGDGTVDCCPEEGAAWFASCAHILLDDPEAADGTYVVTNGGHTFQVWCHDMASGAPKEYLTLERTGDDRNYSTWGDELRTDFEKVRLRPDTLQLLLDDYTFATSDGGQICLSEACESDWRYGTAGACMGGVRGSANVDLRGTPFFVAEPYAVDGWGASGEATFSHEDQVVDAWALGSCGYSGPWALPLETGDDLLLDLGHRGQQAACAAAVPWPVCAGGWVVGWGMSNYGQAQPPAELNDAVQVEGGGVHSLALRADGTVVAWGTNEHGACDVPPGLEDIVQVSAGFTHSMALTGNGTVVAWGNNAYRQTEVPLDLTDVVQISGGYHHSAALRADGTVVAWGRNDDGQADVPTDLTDVVQVSAGHWHTAALRRDGTVVAWGRSAEGQLDVPAGLDGVVQVSAGASHNLALRADGAVVAWGWNLGGQRDVPQDLADVVRVDGGEQHSVAHRRDGSIVVWGSDSHFQRNAPGWLGSVCQVVAADLHNLVIIPSEP